MKLMVLGAGVYQVPVIRRAKALGYEVIVCSRPGPYPGVSAATRFYPVDTTDIEGCLKIARDENISGIISPGTDVALPALGAINETLQLHGLRKNPAVVATDKLLMQQAFKDGGVRSASFVVASTYEEVRKAAESTGFPVVMKIVDSSGSRGVEIVASPTHLKDAFERCKAATHKQSLLIEEYLQGEEFGAQAFVLDGHLSFFLPHGDFVRRTESGQVPIGHYVPYTLPSDILANAKEQVGLCIKALALDNCALNFDFMLCEGKVYVLEIGARSGATGLGEMVSRHYGIDYDEYMIRAACGEKPALRFEPRTAVSVMLLTSEMDGVLEGVTFPDGPHEGLVEKSVDYPPGTLVRRFRTGPDRIGQIIFEAKTADEANCRMKEFMQGIKVRVSKSTTASQDDPTPAKWQG